MWYFTEPTRPPSQWEEPIVLKVTPTPELNDWHLSLGLLVFSFGFEQRDSACTHGGGCTWVRAHGGRSTVNVHPGREFNSPSKPLTKKHGEFPHSRLGPSRWCECIAVHWGFLFSAFISAAFSSCYEKLIFLLTLLEKDMSLCAPIQDNQVILVHMPPRISPPAPWPLSSAKSYLPSGLYGVSTRS